MSDGPIALVYRQGCKACGRACCPHSKGRGRQYAFDTLEGFASWCERKPYRDEVVKVIPIVDRRALEAHSLPASDAPEWLAARRAQA